MTDWQTLVRSYCPADKRVCNCGDAYETLRKGGGQRVIVTSPGAYFTEPVDVWVCQHGCQAAQLWARDHVARCIVHPEPIKLTGSVELATQGSTGRLLKGL